MKKHEANMLYIDCFSGISGDMLMAAFFGLGLSFDAWAAEMDKLNLDEKPEYEITDVLVSGIKAKRFSVKPAGGHHDGGHHGRTLGDIERIIEKGRLDEATASKSLDAFRRLAACEGAIHGKQPSEIHFHELSGLDTIIDVVGAFVAVRLLEIGGIVSSPVNVGSGIIECEHGTFPVPAPATAKLLEGKPVLSRFTGELTTPTGALLVTQLASSFGNMPPMTIAASGCGAGSRDYGHPNYLRLFLGRETAGQDARGHDSVFIVSTNIDDSDSRLIGFLLERLLENGALDVYLEPAYMKKNRPACILNVICEPSILDPMIEIIMRESTTLGVRIQTASRVCMERRLEIVETRFGPIRIKIGVWKGEILRINPEYEDCAKAALKTGAPLVRVMDEAKAEAERKFRR